MGNDVVWRVITRPVLTSFLDPPFLFSSSAVSRDAGSSNVHSVSASEMAFSNTNMSARADSEGVSSLPPDISTRDLEKAQSMASIGSASQMSSSLVTPGNKDGIEEHRMAQI